MIQRFATATALKEQPVSAAGDSHAFDVLKAGAAHSGIRHFNDAVQGRGQPFATGEDGIRSLAVGLAVQESAKTGQRTPVTYQTR